MTREGRIAKWWILGLATPSVILLDQITKYVVLGRFHHGETISVISGFFNLTFVKNTGAAFGILAAADPTFRVPFFVVVPIGALIAIGFIFRKLPDNDLKLSTALSLVIGGAIGNLIDRVLLGFVVDFLDFHWRYQAHFPAFNVADSAICVGVAVLMLDLAVREEQRAPSPR